VTLRVDAGELIAIVGPSGSGKSTMLQVMGTLDRPTSGVVKIDGIEVSQLSDRKLSAARARMIGFVFQQFFLLDGATAVENVANGLLYSGTPKRRRLERAAVALDRVGLGHRLHHNPNELSGGERQRVAIARALVHDPAIVLADEPTGNLDSKSSESVVQLLHDLHHDGRTIVVITHDRDLAASLPRQVGVRDGQLDENASTSLVGAST
jgi:putative ABC transport system ATP-binding protein